MAKKKKFNFESSLLEFNQVNDGFARVKILVMTHEQTANGTHFNKEVINKRLSGLNYLPVVAEFKSKIEDGKEVGDFGTHGGRLELDDDGFRIIDTTKPYGVIISDSYKWENVKLKNGEFTEYLTAEAFVWIERYPELEKLYEGKLNNQSMEIKVLEGHFNEDTWVYEVDDFVFSALCILGTDVKPAFNEAKVLTDYSQKDFKEEYQQMIFSLNKYLQESDSKEVFELDNEKLENIEQNEEFEVEENENPENQEIEMQEEVDEKDESTEKNTEDNFEEEQEEIETVDYKKLYNDLMIKFNTLTENYNILSAQTTKLQEYKNEKIKAEKESKVEEFSSRLDEDELKVVRDNLNNMSIDDIEIKCFALLGMKNVDGKVDKKKSKKLVTKNFTADKQVVAQSWYELV